MTFERSQIMVLGRDGTERPWRWNPAPIYGNGPLEPPTVPGVQQQADGVFILFSDALVETLRANLTQVQKDELSQWVDRRTEEQCAEWHVPVWAGQSSGVFLRIPAAVWNDPTGTPPSKVRNYLQFLWRAAQ
jgi:hypothetical protein